VGPPDAPLPDQFLKVSARTGEGVPALLDAVREFLGGRSGEAVGESVLTHARHHDAVCRASASVRSSMRALAAAVPHEIVALDLYAALGALNELTGDTVTDDILGRIFATFCVGK
jgi:tRNA modification GTPase